MSEELTRRIVGMCADMRFQLTRRRPVVLCDLRCLLVSAMLRLSTRTDRSQGEDR